LLLCLRLGSLPQLKALCQAHVLGLALYAVFITWMLRYGEQRWALALRAWATIGCVIGGLYFSLGPVAFGAIPWRADPWLSAWDTALGWGISPSLACASLARPWAVEFFSFAYGVFLPFLYVSMLLNCWGRPIEENRRFVNGLACVYCIGYVFYLALPSEGPVAYLAAAYPSPLQGGFFFRQMLQGVALSGGNHGAFPSLHVAVSLYLSLFDLRHNRVRGAIFLPLALWIAFATLLLRWHYLVDVLAGCLLALAALRLFSARGGPAYRLKPDLARLGPDEALAGAALELFACAGRQPKPLGQEEHGIQGEWADSVLASFRKKPMPGRWSGLRAFLLRLRSLGVRPADLYLPTQKRLAWLFVIREGELFAIAMLPMAWVHVSLLPLGWKPKADWGWPQVALLACETALLTLVMPLWGVTLYGTFLAYCCWFALLYDSRLRMAWQRIHAFFLWRREPDLRRELAAEGLRWAGTLGSRSRRGSV
jgi:hypothetical protein